MKLGYINTKESYLNKSTCGRLFCGSIADLIAFYQLSHKQPHVESSQLHVSGSFHSLQRRLFPSICYANNNDSLWEQRSECATNINSNLLSTKLCSILGEKSVQRQGIVLVKRQQIDKRFIIKKIWARGFQCFGACMTISLHVLNYCF